MRIAGEPDERNGALADDYFKMTDKLYAKEMEIKLTNVARASLEELLDDYRDFLRVRDYAQWNKDSKEALYIRRLGKN